MATASAPIVRFCATCRGDVSFEQPDCLEAHDEDCPEWVCVVCGEAVFLGFTVRERATAPHAKSHVA